jgi:uncharacterized glyoxalase superfamily protein PhnB
MVDGYYKHAVAAGGEILVPITDTFYGDHGFSLRDPEDNHWHVGTAFWIGGGASAPKTT